MNISNIFSYDIHVVIELLFKIGAVALLSKMAIKYAISAILYAKEYDKNKRM